MYLECARIYVGGVKLLDARRFAPRARMIGGRVYIGYDNAGGEVFKLGELIADKFHGFVETEAD